ncbi:MAG: SRPBCC domain-containing protein [Myxococcaceae bacterium]|nr:SRPBCC domain-containing protein [Myxococcaceae bacterium]
MGKVLKAVAALTVIGLGVFIWLKTGTVVREVKKPGELKADGVTVKTRTDDALDYSVAIYIGAPAPIVWALLVDANAYPQWNSTIVKLDGTIRKTERLKLVAKIAPERTFDLKVTDFQKEKRMVWEDGDGAFAGVRTFTLIPNEGGGVTFAMSETLSGRMLPMIEGSLPDFTPEFNGFAADLKKVAEKIAPPG